MNQNIYHTSAEASDASKSPHLVQNNHDEPAHLQALYHDRKHCLIEHYSAGIGSQEGIPDSLFVPFNCDIQRPRLVDFPHGTITVDGMNTEEITRQIHTIHQQPYSYHTARLLANPKFRMLFQNIFQEPTSVVYRNMLPLQKEIDRVFFRILLADEEQDITEFQLATPTTVHERDMPYRSLAFVVKLYTVCSEIFRTEPSDRQQSYLNHILKTEHDQVSMENEYNFRHKLCTKRNLNFAKVIDLYQYEQQHIAPPDAYI